MASVNEKATPMLLVLIAALVGYIGYTGTGISSLGMSGLQARKARVTAMKDTLATLEGEIASARKELARGTAEDLRKRLDGHRASLALLRRLVPASTEVPTLLAGLSRKKTIGDLTGRDDPRERVAGSVAAHLVAAQRGARLLRVHDVAAAVQALVVVEATARARR